MPGDSKTEVGSAPQRFAATIFNSCKRDSNPNDPGQTGSSRKCALKEPSIRINSCAPLHNPQAVRTTTQDQRINLIDHSPARIREGCTRRELERKGASAFFGAQLVRRRVADSHLLGQRVGVEKAEIGVAVDRPRRHDN